MNARPSPSSTSQIKIAIGTHHCQTGRVVDIYYQEKVRSPMNQKQLRPHQPRLEPYRRLGAVIASSQQKKAGTHPISSLYALEHILYASKMGKI